MPTNNPSPKTMDGWPSGEQVKTPDNWVVCLGLEAHTKLMAWHREARGLELSGFAILDDTPHADPEGSKIFFIDDIILICDIDESSGGYTEMTPEQRFQGMKWAMDMGRSPNQLVWWHIHPISGWSGIDLNTRRQRLHETGMRDKLAALSMVLTPKGIRACWDQANPDIFIDSIPLVVGTPGILQINDEAEEECRQLLADRTPIQVIDMDEEAVEVPQTNGTAPDMPKPSWKRRVLQELPPFAEGWAEDELEDASLMLYGHGLQEQAAAMIIADKLTQMEVSNGYLCRKDPEMTVDLDTCASCPFFEQCFEVTQADVNHYERSVVEDLKEEMEGYY